MSERHTPPTTDPRLFQVRCACPSNFARRCIALRGGDGDERCPCACHEGEDDDAE